MMNGPGKSDSSAVPAKSPNKTGQPAAEGMEGKGLAKGNLPQQNASRTPSRKGAPSALERVRQAAAKGDFKSRCLVGTSKSLWHRLGEAPGMR